MSFLLPRSTEDPYYVSRHAESKITLKMTEIAQRHCQDTIAEYNECCRGRSISMIFMCKSLYNKSQDCFHLYVNESTVDTVKRRWVDAGRPTRPDWQQMLAGLDQTPEERKNHPDKL